MCYIIFTQLGYGPWAVAFQKQRLGPKLEGAGLGEHPNFGTVTYFYIKFGTQLAFGTTLPKTTLMTKIDGVWARGASEKKLGPLRIYVTIKASNFKFGTQLGFGLAYQRHLGPKLVGVWARGASQ